MNSRRGHAILEMVCGKGGYVRSIARDLGAKWDVMDMFNGCDAWSGPFVDQPYRWTLLKTGALRRD